MLKKGTQTCGGPGSLVELHRCIVLQSCSRASCIVHPSLYAARCAVYLKREYAISRYVSALQFGLSLTCTLEKENQSQYYDRF